MEDINDEDKIREEENYERETTDFYEDFNNQQEN